MLLTKQKGRNIKELETKLFFQRIDTSVKQRDGSIELEKEDRQNIRVILGSLQYIKLNGHGLIRYV